MNLVLLYFSNDFTGEPMLMEHPTIQGMLGQLHGVGIPMMSFFSKLVMTGSLLTRKNSLEQMVILIIMSDLPKL